MFLPAALTLLRQFTPHCLTCLSTVLLIVTSNQTAANEVLHLNLRTRAEVAPGMNQYREALKPATWQADQTAIVICDMWNDHYCRNAARRVAVLSHGEHQDLNTFPARGAAVLGWRQAVHVRCGCQSRFAAGPTKIMPRVDCSARFGAGSPAALPGLKSKCPS